MSLDHPITPPPLGTSSSKKLSSASHIPIGRTPPLTQNPSRSRRFLILLCFPLIMLLGVPYWWHTTSIVRLPLPVERIAALEGAPMTTTKSFILLTAAEGSYPPAPPGRAQYKTSEVVEALGGLVQKRIDRIYAHKLLPSRSWEFVYKPNRRNPHALHIHITPSPTANTSFPLQPYVQSAAHSAFGREQVGTMVLPIHPDQVGDRSLREHISLALVHGLLSTFPNTPPEIPLRALKYSPNITLSFVLLNEDAAAGSYVRSWDIQGAIKEHIQPHIDALSPVFNFSIESQILYHAPLSFNPKLQSLRASQATGDVGESTATLEQAIEEAAQGDTGAEAVARLLIDEENIEQAYVIDEEQMKVFVNSERWTLDSGSSQNPVLRFLLFIPSATHRPMRLSASVRPTSDPGSSSDHSLSSTGSAQSFLIPQFGGVVLLSPPSSQRPTSESVRDSAISDIPPYADSSETKDDALAFHLSSPALAPAFHLFTQQLYSLLALPVYPDRLFPCPPNSLAGIPRDTQSVSGSGSESGLMEPFSRWQLETILRQRMAENEGEARKTLAGIVRLVGKIKEMQVGEGVRGMVLGAVERLERMANTTDPLQSFILSRDAVSLADEAFFDPSMMGLLYFPNEHKFAVYTPLFAPVSVPLVIGLLKELVGWIKRRRARRAVVGTTPGEEAEGKEKEEKEKKEKKEEKEEEVAVRPERKTGEGQGPGDKKVNGNVAFGVEGECRLDSKVENRVVNGEDGQGQGRDSVGVGGTGGLGGGRVVDVNGGVAESISGESALAGSEVLGVGGVRSESVGVGSESGGSVSASGSASGRVLRSRIVRST